MNSCLATRGRSCALLSVQSEESFLFQGVGCEALWKPCPSPPCGEPEAIHSPCEALVLGLSPEGAVGGEGRGNKRLVGGAGRKPECRYYLARRGRWGAGSGE